MRVPGQLWGALQLVLNSSQVFPVWRWCKAWESQQDPKCCQQWWVRRSVQPRLVWHSLRHIADSSWWTAGQIEASWRKSLRADWSRLAFHACFWWTSSSSSETFLWECPSGLTLWKPRNNPSNQRRKTFLPGVPQALECDTSCLQSAWHLNYWFSADSRVVCHSGRSQSLKCPARPHQHR